MKKLLITTLTVLISTVAFAQSPQENLHKYWWYRYQLVNDYMKIGLYCGESVPGNNRRAHAHGNFPDTITKFHDHDINPNTPDIARNAYLHWGDATIPLGQYMGILATEYRILRLASQNTDRTIYELYHALKAYERLDREMESRCRNFENTTMCQNINPASGDLNGFFMRDDVPEYFVDNNLRHFNRDKVPFKITAGFSDVMGRSESFYGFPHKDGPWASRTFGADQIPNNGAPQYPTEMSQDQVVQIYSGLALTVKLVDGSVEYNGNNIKKMAQDAIFRLTVYCESNGKWEIRNALDGKFVYGNHPERYNTGNSKFDGGGIMMLSSVPMAAGLENIGASWEPNQQLKITWMKNTVPKTFRDAYQSTKAVFKCKVNGDVKGNVSNNQFYFPALFSAYGGTYKIGPKNVTREILSITSSACDLRWPEIPLIYQLIHGRPAGIISPSSLGAGLTYVDLLNIAPPCNMYNFKKLGTNNNFENDKWYTWQWSSPNRLAEFYKRGEDLEEYVHGIPYMLLFNLHVLTDPNYNLSVSNPYYVKDNDAVWPLNIVWTTLGTHLNPFNYDTYEYLSTKCKVNSNASVTYRNAKEINLIPGFESQHGAVFLAHIEDYDCDNIPPSGNEIVNGDYHAFESTDIFSTEMTPYEIPELNPEDPDYECTDSMRTADSIALADSILNSGDSTVILLYKKIFGLDTTDEDTSMSKPGSGTHGSKLNNKEESYASGKLSRNKKVIVSFTGNGRFSIYPNPTTELLVIEAPEKSNYYIRVMNIVGSTVYEGKMEGEQKKSIQLDQNLPPGNYTIHIHGDGLRHIEKLVITK